MTPDDYRQQLIDRCESLLAELRRADYEDLRIREIALDIMAILDDEAGV